MDNNRDKYGTSVRAAMKRSMSEPAGYVQLNRRSRPHYDNLRVFLWAFAGLLAGATAILIYDRLIQGVR